MTIKNQVNEYLDILSSLDKQFDKFFKNAEEVQKELKSFEDTVSELGSNIDKIFANDEVTTKIISEEDAIFIKERIAKKSNSKIPFELA